MSEQLTRTSLGAGTITRRTALRGAAWTAPAVTIAVSAPAYASTSGGGQITPTAVTWIRNGTVMTATTALASATTLAGVSCLATLTFNGGNGTMITTTTVPLPWTADLPAAGSAQFQLPTLAGGQSEAFQPSFDLTNVSYLSFTWSFVFTWAGGGTATMGGTYLK